VTAPAAETAAANHAALTAFTRLDVRQIALLLDVDGTLIDIAPTPQEVHVSDDLCRSLARLCELTGGALALVSGRPIADLDQLFAPLKLAAVGGHGAEMRLPDGERVSTVTPLPPALRRRLGEIAAPGSGLLIEDKTYSVALHYRQAPQQEARLRQHIAAVRAEFPGEPLEVLLGKALFEIKRPGIDKGAAVRALMTQAPFAGRRPVFIGDDVTDESVFAILPALGGVGFSVHRRFDGLAGIFESPAEVRRALRELAAH
jgi:trehalose 6-phosphate phosphatase